MRVPRPTESSRPWWVLATMTGALAMIMIDATVVSVALPTIQAEFDSSPTRVQWVMNAYLLTGAAFVAVAGRLGDMYGHRRLFVIGTVVFTLTSLAAGAAQSDVWLIAARGAEGIGAAIMLPTSMAIVTNAFPAETRGRAMGIFAGGSMLALVAGPLLGGVLTELVGWRSIFFINLPLGVVVVGLTYVSMRADPARRAEETLDWPGLVTLVCGLSAVVLALMQSSVWGWGSPATIVLLGGGLVVLAAFVRVELRAEHPLVELRLFRSRNVSADVLVLAAGQFAVIGLTVFGAIWIQNVLGFAPIEAGLSLLPITIPLIVVAPIAGALYDRVGPRALVGIGLAFAAAGFAWAAATLDRESFALLAPGYLLIGIGLGAVMTPATTDTMNSALPRLRGAAGGVVQTVRQVGGTVGLAIMGTVVAGVQASRLTELLTSDPRTSAADLARTEHLLSEAEAGQQQALSDLSPRILDHASEALTSGVATTYWVAAGVLAATAAIAVAAIRHVGAVDAVLEPHAIDRGEAAEPDTTGTSAA